MQAGGDVEECGEDEPVAISNSTLHVVGMKSRRTRGKVPSPGQKQDVRRVYGIYLKVSRVPATRSIYSLSTRISIAYNPSQDQTVMDSANIANLFDIQNHGHEPS